MSIVHPMSNLKISHNSFVVVSDGRKALFLRNAGDEKFPNLKTEEVLADDNPPTHEQGADRPGRTFKRANTNRRAAIAETDLHDREEQRFLRTVADRMERLVREQKPDALVVAAPARALAVLRHQLHPDVRARVILETDKDLTNHPIYEIERHLFGE